MNAQSAAPLDGAQIEYGVCQAAEDFNAHLRERSRELGEREAARKPGISRTALRRAMGLGAEAMDGVMRGRLAANCNRQGYKTWYCSIKSPPVGIFKTRW
jgi:hypothetical protein